MKTTITKREFERLADHIRKDISYEADGTFGTLNPATGEHEFDDREATMVGLTVDKLAILLEQIELAK